MKRITKYIIVMIILVCTCTAMGAKLLPPADPDKPLYQKGRIFKHKVAWPMPKTEEELELMQKEIRMKADAENAARFQKLCARFNVLWLAGMAVCMGLAFYFKSKLFGIMAVTCTVMLPLTYSMATSLPKAAPWVAGGTTCLVLGFLAMVAWKLAKGLKGEGTALKEVVATFQRIKGRDWNEDSKSMAGKIQSKPTQDRVAEIKASLP